MPERIAREGSSRARHEMYEVEGAEYRRVAGYDRGVCVRTTLFPNLEIDLGRVWV